MFEEESKEYANRWLEHVKDLELQHKTDEKPEYIRILEAHQKGAEFGYNKANEWHYMKNVKCYEDLHFPPIEDCKGRICIWKVKDCSENYHCGTYEALWYEINAYHVIAWKEIILPKLKESE